MNPDISIVLLAAGASSRMLGQDKLLLPVAGVPMLRHCAMAACSSRASRTIVVIAPDRPERAATLEGLDVALVIAKDWANGMSASIKAGLTAAAQSEAVIIALADMPEIAAAHHNALIDAYSPETGAWICRATTPDGRAGHPVLFGRRFFTGLGKLRGDNGARNFLLAAKNSVTNVAFPGEAAISDLDTPDDFRRWAG